MTRPRPTLYSRSESSPASRVPRPDSTPPGSTRERGDCLGSQPRRYPLGVAGLVPASGREADRSVSIPHPAQAPPARHLGSPSVGAQRVIHRPDPSRHWIDDPPLSFWVEPPPPTGARHVSASLSSAVRRRGHSRTHSASIVILNRSEGSPNAGNRPRGTGQPCWNPRPSDPSLRFRMTNLTTHSPPWPSVANEPPRRRGNVTRTRDALQG